MKPTRYDRALDRLAVLLRKKTLTAKAIAAELKCCIPTAYQRLQALIDRGEPVVRISGPSKQPGPRPTQFSIRDEA